MKSSVILDHLHLGIGIGSRVPAGLRVEYLFVDKLLQDRALHRNTYPKTQNKY